MPLQSFKTKYLKQNALKPSIILLNQSHFGAVYGIPIHAFGGLLKINCKIEHMHFTNATFNVFAKVITVMEVIRLDIALKT